MPSSEHPAARVPFTDPEPEAVERERPEIRTVEDFWCWWKFR